MKLYAFYVGPERPEAFANKTGFINRICSHNEKNYLVSNCWAKNSDLAAKMHLKKITFTTHRTILFIRSAAMKVNNILDEKFRSSYDRSSHSILKCRA